MTKFLIFGSCIALVGFLSGEVTGIHQANARESKFMRGCLPDKPGVRVIVSLRDGEPACEKHEHVGYGMAVK